MFEETNSRCFYVEFDISGCTKYSFSDCPTVRTRSMTLVLAGHLSILLNLQMKQTVVPPMWHSIQMDPTVWNEWKLHANRYMARYRQSKLIHWLVHVAKKLHTAQYNCIFYEFNIPSDSGVLVYHG